nr:unnamed protein product [Callosobruchus analis]
MCTSIKKKEEKSTEKEIAAASSDCPTIKQGALSKIVWRLASSFEKMSQILPNERGLF